MLSFKYVTRITNTPKSFFIVWWKSFGYQCLAAESEEAREFKLQAEEVVENGYCYHVT